MDTRWTWTVDTHHTDHGTVVSFVPTRPKRPEAGGRSRCFLEVPPTASPLRSDLGAEHSESFTARQTEASKVGAWNFTPIGTGVVWGSGLL